MWEVCITVLPGNWQGFHLCWPLFVSFVACDRSLEIQEAAALWNVSGFELQVLFAPQFISYSHSTKYFSAIQIIFIIMVLLEFIFSSNFSSLSNWLFTHSNSLISTLYYTIISDMLIHSSCAYSHNLIHTSFPFPFFL